MTPPPSDAGGLARRAAEDAARELAVLVGPALATTRRLAYAPVVDLLLRQSLLAPDRGRP